MTRKQRPAPKNRRSPMVWMVVLAGALFLCILATFLIWAANRPAAGPGAAADSRSATLTVAYSPEKAALFKGLVDKFNAKGLRTSDREQMKVVALELAPDEMVAQALASPGASPGFQALTPDSSLWLDQLNRQFSQSQNTAAGEIPPRLVGESVRYAVSPIVIAAWEDTARSLGWPGKTVGWTTLQARAQQDANFKWNHASTSHASGLLATLAEFYAGAGVQRGLTAAMAQDPKTVAFVTAVEKTVRYYGEDELAVAKRVAQDGAKYLDAFVVSEQTVVALNTGVYGKAPARLVALYPAEGTLWADHPLALLENPDVTANQRATFQAFREFLTSAPIQAEVLKAGYRPADLSISLTGSGSPLTSTNGVDPAQPQTTLQLPSSDVVATVQNVWALTKRRTNVMLVVDTSGSMAGEKINNVQGALRTFVAQIPSDQERVGMVNFDTTVTDIIELDTLKVNRTKLAGQIDNLEAGGNTALLDAVQTAYRRLQKLADPERINAIVVMTDGLENASSVNIKNLTAEIKAGNTKVPVVIFAIAYGSDADTATLKALADASGGQVRTGTPQTIKDLYKILSSYF